MHGDTHRHARAHRPWHPADSPFIERQRQQPGSCVASTRQPSHPQRVGFASESASNLCEQVDARCADFGPRAMELGRGLRASLRLAVRRSSSIVACRLREFRMTNLLWCVGEQCAGRRGRQWPHTAIGKPSRTRRRTQTLLWLLSRIALRKATVSCVRSRSGGSAGCRALWGPAMRPSVEMELESACGGSGRRHTPEPRAIGTMN